jgi:polyisoprenyl-teichoic acid--peptidoglycan teichoic acid transferase
LATTIPQPSIPRGPERPARSRLRTALRIFAGCLSVVVTGAVVGGMLANGQVNNIVSALNQKQSVGVSGLAPAGWGGPQTLLLVGNDQRAHTTTSPVLPHSNEMLLVRFDPSKPFISMMSLPRELEVPIDTANGVVNNRFNAAFTYGTLNGGGISGGISLMVKTIKQVTGLSINHVVVIDFNEFQDAINQMGCVYSSVDRPYYHLNVPGGAQYFQISLQPGYQKMCGTQALQFVAYRHGDLSTIRDARDQDFLLALKQEFGQNLLGNIGKFESIFGKLVQTDPSLHSSTGVLDLLGTLISSAGDPVRQVQFHVTLGKPSAAFCSCDTATPQQIASSVQSFLYGAVSVPKKGTTQDAKTLARKRLPATLPVVAVPASEVAEAKSVAMSANLGFPLEYPRLRDANALGSPIDLNSCVAINNDDTYPLSCMRTYKIDAPGGKRYPAYVIVTSNGTLGQYYDIQGTTWTAAPLFDNPTQAVHVDGRTYALYYQGAHLETVAWFEHGAVYWIHNTLLDSISNAEMLALAEHTLPVTATPRNPNPGGGSTSLPSSVIPASGTSGVTSAEQLVGSIGGVVALVLLPLLLWLILRRARNNSGLRDRLRDLALRESALIVRAGAAGLPISALNSPSSLGPAGVGGVAGVGGLSAGGGAVDPLDVRVYDNGGGWLGWFRRSRVAVRASVVVLLLVLVLGGAGLLVSVALGRRSETVVRYLPPAVAVEVLNATSTSGDAAHLAADLRSRGVKIAGVGDLVASLHHRDYVLYARGEKAQAERLADLLGSMTVKPQPMSATDAAVVGSAQLAVVIG